MTSGFNPWPPAVYKLMQTSVHYTKSDTSWGYRRRNFHHTVCLTLCLQPASLKGQRTRALPQLSFTWLARSSRAMLGVPHWFGHWTGNRGQWYWWFCRRKSVVRAVRLDDSRRNRTFSAHVLIWTVWVDDGLTWMVSKTNSLPQYLHGCVRLGHSAMPCWDSSRRIILAPHLFSQ